MMKEKPQISETPSHIKLAKQGLAAAFSACVGEFVTIPMDTIKVRL